MKNIIELISTGATVIILILIVATISGTIIWATWDVIKIFYPLEYLPEDPTWWQCVKVAWLTSTVMRLFLPNVEIKKS